jgi:hypothetical protein
MPEYQGFPGDKCGRDMVNCSMFGAATRRVWITKPALQKAAMIAKMMPTVLAAIAVCCARSKCGASITSTPMKPTITADQR